MPRPTFRQRGYSARWDRERRAFLIDHAWCVMCSAEGRGTRATVVDHRVPHRGNESLMWSPSNWQPLCGTCHNSTKQQVERRGYHTRVRPDGTPADARHPFYAGSHDEPEPAKARHAPPVPPCEAIRGHAVETPGGVKAGRSKGSVPHGYRRRELVAIFPTEGSA